MLPQTAQTHTSSEQFQVPVQDVIRVIGSQTILTKKGGSSLLGCTFFFGREGVVNRFITCPLAAPASTQLDSCKQEKQEQSSAHLMLMRHMSSHYKHSKSNIQELSSNHDVVPREHPARLLWSSTGTDLPRFPLGLEGVLGGCLDLLPHAFLLGGGGCSDSCSGIQGHKCSLCNSWPLFTGC